MSAFWFEDVERFPDGHPKRKCVRCRRRATVTASLRNHGTRFKVPVGYCGDHEPAEVAT